MILLAQPFPRVIILLGFMLTDLLWVYVECNPMAFTISSNYPPLSRKRDSVARKYRNSAASKATTSRFIPTTTETPFNQTFFEEIVKKFPETLFCDSNSDCTSFGKCIKQGSESFAKGLCYCPLACPYYIPMSCQTYSTDTCGKMDRKFASQFPFTQPTCINKRCACPPQFDVEESIIKQNQTTAILPPVSCDRRNLKAIISVTPNATIARGTDVTLHCCINMDPMGIVLKNSVTFEHSGGYTLSPTSNPYDDLANSLNKLKSNADENHDTVYQSLYHVPRCWSVIIQNTQISDSGEYICTATPDDISIPVAKNTLKLIVKGPPKFENLTINSTATNALIQWNIQEGTDLTTDLRLVDRNDNREVWIKNDSLSSVNVSGLMPARSYTLYLTLKQADKDPFKFMETFDTKDSIPDPPTPLSVQTRPLQDGLVCEVEWKEPKVSNGVIQTYYASVQGKVRYETLGGSVTSDHYPEPVQFVCKNNAPPTSPSDEKIGMSTLEFNNVISCKYGPLKPNRNYTVTLWAENKAGISAPAIFNQQCITNYAEPEYIEQPKSVQSIVSEHTFSLQFGNVPEETNGPIACYYLAIVPLWANVSMSSLPAAGSILIDTFSRTLANNLQTSSVNLQRYYAYIAESYSRLPKETTVGDGNTTVQGYDQCNAIYLSRYKAEDSALKLGLQYTGFLIARVDHDPLLTEDHQKFSKDGSKIFRRPSSFISTHNGHNNEHVKFFEQLYKLHRHKRHNKLGREKEKKGESVYMPNDSENKGNKLKPPNNYQTSSTFTAASQSDNLTSPPSAHIDKQTVLLGQLPPPKSTKSTFKQIGPSKSVIPPITIPTQYHLQEYLNDTRREKVKGLDIASEQGSGEILTSNHSRHRRNLSSYHKNIRSAKRQISKIDPTYGYSDYFKPVTLTADNFRSKEKATGSNYFIIIVSLSFFILLIVFIIFLFQKFGFFRGISSHKKEHIPLGHLNESIPIHELTEEYVIRHRDSDFIFTQEFEKLPTFPSYPHVACELKENIKKNRYNNVKPYDSTRVILKQIHGEKTSDYINANTIKGYENKKTFIATQGPNEETIDDFWRMIWETNSAIIVMVSNLSEKNRKKVDKYWPEDEPIIVCENCYDDDPAGIQIRIINSTYCSDFVIREFEIRKKKIVSVSGFDETDQMSVTNSLIDKNQDTNYYNLPNPATHLDGTPVYANVKRYSNGKLASICADERTSMSDDQYETRTIYQYHFTSWDDYKAPEAVTGLLRFLFRLRDTVEFNQQTVVVHCSAGVGRTGTLLAIDYALDQIEKEQTVDIFKCVSEMRKQRMMMVQSLEQYVFIYRALAEFYLFGNTDIPKENFEFRYMELMENCKNNNNGEKKKNNVSITYDSSKEKSNSVSLPSLIQNKAKSIGFKSAKGVGNQSIKDYGKNNSMITEYNNISTRLEPSKTTNQANRIENSVRNRFENAVPYDNSRVLLTSCVGYTITYVNATRMKGYFFPYILAQDPIDNDACFDFWRMISDCNVSNIVMLSCESEYLPNEIYWPKEIGAPVFFGHNHECEVELVDVEIHPSYTQRKILFKINQDKVKISQEVVQYVYTSWPENSIIPSSTTSLIELIAKVMEKQTNEPVEVGPIVLHCRNGSGRSAVYCAVSLLLERLKTENHVDIFETVRQIALNRPCTFPNLEQYEYCYQCIRSYLNNSLESN
uniref:Protein-tyrosine-phosphatase n=1 Tax=Rhabditophanes sp. KR3021 TaxID=114890 RepID=A0AC35U6K5_9BILA